MPEITIISIKAGQFQSTEGLNLTGFKNPLVFIT